MNKYVIPILILAFMAIIGYAIYITKSAQPLWALIILTFFDYKVKWK